MDTNRAEQQRMVDSLKTAIRETEVELDRGDFPSSSGIGNAPPPLSFEERLSLLRARLAEAEAKLEPAA
jgi:hypothetical protein